MAKSLFPKDYLSIIKERTKASRVYKQHQSVGLALAEILEDDSHKSLYMKLAKQHDHQMLIALAKDIAERKNVQNRGAYFMRMLQKQNETKNSHRRR